LVPGKDYTGKRFGEERDKGDWSGRLKDRKPGGWEAWSVKLEDRGWGAWSSEMDNDRWRNLDVWKKADELAFKVYKLTRDFPKEEIYGNHITTEKKCPFNPY
jgi:hypothetical protein